MDYPEDTVFEVEAILDKRWNAELNKSEYLVKYKARHLVAEAAAGMG